MGKYVNAVPLYRLEQEFQRYGLQITRQNMANWCIRLAEEYLSILYDHLHEELYFYHVIQADETPVLETVVVKHFCNTLFENSPGISSFKWCFPIIVGMRTDMIVPYVHISV